MVTSPRSSSYNPAPSIPLEWSDPVEHRRKIAEGAEMALEGKLRSAGTVTLTASDTTTTLSDRRIGPQSVILLFPTTANGAAAVKTGTGVYVSARTDESATITHGNSPNTDQTFMYAVLG